MNNTEPIRVHNEDRKHIDPSTHFNVPEGYFEDLKDNIMARVSELQEEEDTLSEDVFSPEASENNLDEAEARPLLVVLRPYLYLAAMFVGMALFFKILPFVNDSQFGASGSHLEAKNTPLDPNYVEISDDEFQSYIWENTQDEYLLATVFE